MTTKDRLIFAPAIIVAAIVIFFAIVYLFPETEDIYTANWFVGVGMYYVSTCYFVPMPIGIIVTLVLGRIFYDIWYAPVVQYLTLELVIKIFIAAAVIIFGGGCTALAKLMDKFSKKSPPETNSPKEQSKQPESESKEESSATRPKIQFRGFPRRSKRLKNKIEKIVDAHPSLFGFPLLVSDEYLNADYEAVSTDYFIVLIWNFFHGSKGPFVKDRLEVDLSILYCGIVYYSYLERYAEDKNYDSSTIAAINESRETFYKLYTDDKDPDNVDFYTNTLSNTISNALKVISYENLSKDITTLICREVIFSDPTWEVVKSDNPSSDEWVETAVNKVTAEWELLCVTSLAYRFIDELQDFIINNELDDSNS